MTIIVEDGSIVADANSYLSLADARTLATTYGFTLPVDDTEAETALINATLYLQDYEARIKGYRVSAEQVLMFPREYVCLNGFELANDAIPDNLKRAEVFAAADFGAGGSPWGGNDDGKSIKKEKVDVLEVEYSETGVTGGGYTIPRVEAELRPLMGSDGLASFSVGRG